MNHLLLPDALLRRALLDGANDRSDLVEIGRVGGGDISMAARVETERGRYFAKWQRNVDSAVMFNAEAEGLTLLRRAPSGLVIPQVIGFASSDEGALLLLEWLEVWP
jgi:fructosamine-3-kinase